MAASPRIGPLGQMVVLARRRLRGWAVFLEHPLASFHVVLALLAVLTGLGLVMVFSASSIASLAAGGDPYATVEHQAVYVLIGLAGFAAVLRIPVRRWRAASPYLVAASAVALLAVLVPGLGASIAGAQKWFVVGPISLQPSEPAKLALVLWGGHVLVARRRSLDRWRAALLPLVPVALLLAGLVVLQPDLGSAVCVVLVLFALLWFAQVPLRLVATLAGGAVASVGVLAMSAGYRMARLTSFLGPDSGDTLGAGYQEHQALYSLADGGLLGTGLGQGAAQWSYLPNASNDFVFALVGEQLGIVGALAVLGLYGVLGWIGLRIAARVDDPFLRVVVPALTVWLVAQALINVGYVLGLLPVTGITLPLISSGGSSTVVTLLALGVIAAAARTEPAARASLAARRPSSSPTWALLSPRRARRPQ